MFTTTLHHRVWWMNWDRDQAGGPSTNPNGPPALSTLQKQENTYSTRDPMQTRPVQWHIIFNWESACAAARCNMVEKQGKKEREAYYPPEKWLGMWEAWSFFLKRFESLLLSAVDNWSHSLQPSVYATVAFQPITLIHTLGVQRTMSVYVCRWKWQKYRG